VLTFFIAVTFLSVPGARR